VTGKAIGLPDEFLAFAEGSKGGGVIQVRIIMNILNKRLISVNSF
jgi:hypothetical protein